jgi:hypothetical protein
VVEAGEETGRLHIHTVLICDVLPCEVSDPNPVKGGTNRVVEELRKYWPHGHSSPVAVRWARDAWSVREDFNWPAVKTDEGLVALDSSVGKLCSYMTKYLTKTTKDERWRVRMSRKFGMKALERKLEKATNKGLIALASLVQPGLVPGMRLVRRVAKITLVKRVFQNLKSNYSSQEMVGRFLRRLSPRESLYEKGVGRICGTRRCRQRRDGILSLTWDREGASEALAIVKELMLTYETRIECVGDVSFQG